MPFTLFLPIILIHYKRFLTWMCVCGKTDRDHSRYWGRKIWEWTEPFAGGRGTRGNTWSRKGPESNSEKNEWMQEVLGEGCTRWYRWLVNWKQMSDRHKNISYSGKQAWEIMLEPLRWLIQYCSTHLLKRTNMVQAKKRAKVSLSVARKYRYFCSHGPIE